MDFYVLDHEANFEDIEKFNYPNLKIGVIAHIENNNGEILLQQRGFKASDENGFYEDIGGKLEPEDNSFKKAIIREINEEVGNDINLEFGKCNFIFHCYKHNTNWIFIVYFTKYMSGNIKIMEPDKCIGYKFFTYDDLIKSDLVTDSCKYLTKSIKHNKLQL